MMTSGPDLRGCVARILLLVAAGTALGQDPAGAPAARRDMARLLPERTLAHVMVSLDPLDRLGSALALMEIMREPEVEAFLMPLQKLVRAMLEKREGEFREETGVGFRELGALAAQGVTLSFIGVEHVDRGAGASSTYPDILLTVECRGQEKAVQALIDSLEAVACSAGASPPEAVTLGGVPLTALRIQSVEVSYGIVDGLLIAGTNRKTIDGALLRMKSGEIAGSLAASPVYARARARAVRENTVLWAYVELKRLLDLIMKEVAEIPEASRDVLALTSLDALQTIGYGMDIDGRGIRDRIYIQLDQERAMARVQRPPANCRIRSASLVPAECGFFMAGVMDLGFSYDAVLELLDTAYPKAAVSFRQGIGRWEERTGTSFRDEVLPLLGPEYGAYAAWPGQAVIPDLCVYVQVKDRARAEGLLSTIRTGLGDQWRIVDLQFEGKVIHYLDLASLHSGGGRSWSLSSMKPVFALVDDWFVVGLWPQAIKNLIHGLGRKAPRLESRDDFTKGLEHLRAEGLDGVVSSITYADLGALAGFLLDNGVPFLQSLVPAGAQVPVDIAAFPSTSTVTKHLFGLLGMTRWTEDGVVSDIYSPTGVVPIYCGVVGAFAGAVYVNAASTTAPPPWEKGMPGAGIPGKAARARAQVQVFLLRDAAQLHLLLEGRLPEELEWPGFLFTGSKANPQPYVDLDDFPDRSLKDPWGQPYVFRRTGDRTFQVISYGSDGKPGGEGEAADLVAGSAR